MPIPRTRAELTEYVTSTFEKLRLDLDRGGPGLGGIVCVDEWTVKDLLAVRAWWTEKVIDWIVSGRRGGHPATPAKGYGWNETPRLNADIVRKTRAESYRSVRARLNRGAARALLTIKSLDDRELLVAGMFPWAGKWPVSRWISLNTARQYTTARTYVRRALRRHVPGV